MKERVELAKKFLAATTVEEVCALIDAIPLQPGRTLAQSMLSKAEAKETFRAAVQEWQEKGLEGPEAVHAAAQGVWDDTITWDGQHR